MKTGLLSVMLSLKNVWPTAKDDVVLCELLLVYGETVVMPENEHNVTDMLLLHVHSEVRPGLGVVVSDLQC